MGTVQVLGGQVFPGQQGTYVVDEPVGPLGTPLVQLMGRRQHGNGRLGMVCVRFLGLSRHSTNTVMADTIV